MPDCEEVASSSLKKSRKGVPYDEHRHPREYVRLESVNPIAKSRRSADVVVARPDWQKLDSYRPESSLEFDSFLTGMSGT